jgi:Na+-transporting NADH:ubiquinone oxidoreductase subunit C
MAINKDSNGYTFAFAITLVVVVGTILALLATGLKGRQDRNEEVKKQLDILSAMMDVDKKGSEIDRSNAEGKFKNFVNLDKAIVLNNKGEVLEGVYDVKGNVVEGKAFDVDIRKEFKDKKRKAEHRNYPLFLGEDEKGKTQYVMPVIGNGLWGPIWGNICLGADMNTIKGASFGHKGETPGLGAEITQKFFINGWVGEKLAAEDGVFAPFKVVKDNSGATTDSKVDGITGGTITSKGVEEMANRCLEVYVTYFNNLKTK